MTAVRKLEREKNWGVLLIFMRLFSLSQIAKCREFPTRWILSDCIRVRKEKFVIAYLCPSCHKRSQHEVSRCIGEMDVIKMYQKVSRTVLLIKPSLLLSSLLKLLIFKIVLQFACFTIHTFQTTSGTSSACWEGYFADSAHKKFWQDSHKSIVVDRIPENTTNGFMLTNTFISFSSSIKRSQGLTLKWLIDKQQVL